MMMKKFVLLRYVLILWMLCGASFTVSTASAYDRTSSSASWGYQPLHATSASPYSSVYGGAIAGNTTRGAYSPSGNQSTPFSQPAYQFRSTSVYLKSMDAGARRIVVTGNDLMKSGWGDPDDDEDDPLAVVKDTPLGEPLILLLFAAAFFGFSHLRRKAELRKRSFLPK